MGVDHQVHRSGALKQTNKSHKTGRHRSKGAIDNEQKGVFRPTTHKNNRFHIETSYLFFCFAGKVSMKALSRRNKNAMTKEQRRHQANQVNLNSKLTFLARCRHAD